MKQIIVEARNLVKKYGDFTAVKNVNFTIKEGEIFGLLGPDGAGKSTVISMLTCLFPPTSGTARIYGHDVVADADQVKRLIGVVPQDLALYPTLSGRDNLRFFGEMFGLAGRELRQRVESVLAYVAMTGRADDPVKTYSGGMQRRLSLAVGLIHRPRILFLDEPAASADPQSRNHIFESVEQLNRERGMAILYATHDMEEAERLCHRVAIMDQGKIIAMDTPRNLIGILPTETPEPNLESVFLHLTGKSLRQ
jgi:ABC-2 type transport system ATP-binding protein